MEETIDGGEDLSPNSGNACTLGFGFRVTVTVTVSVMFGHTSQNAAARLLTGVRRRDDILPVLSRLHLLPVKQRVIYKLATVVYKSPHG